MKCAYHTVGVIYDTVEVAVTLIKIGVTNTSPAVSYITLRFGVVTFKK